MKPGFSMEAPSLHDLQRTLVLEGREEAAIAGAVLTEALFGDLVDVEMPAVQRQLIADLNAARGLGTGDTRCKLRYPVAGVVLRALRWYSEHQPDSDPVLVLGARRMLCEHDDTTRLS